VTGGHDLQHDGVAEVLLGLVDLAEAGVLGGQRSVTQIVTSPPLNDRFRDQWVTNRSEARLEGRSREAFACKGSEQWGQGDLNPHNVAVCGF
jgi:hypothetical protein